LYRAADLPNSDRKALGASEIMRAVYHRLLGRCSATAGTSSTAATA
jgi:hypothetical protein